VRRILERLRGAGYGRMVHAVALYLFCAGGIALAIEIWLRRQVSQHVAAVLDAGLLALFAGGLVYLVIHFAMRRGEEQLAALRVSEERFRGLTELSADWFWETDSEHRFTWVSGGGPVLLLFGGTPVFGVRIWEVPGVEIDPRALSAHQERLGARLPFFDLEVWRSDERGARLVHILSGEARRAPDGTFLGYRGVGRDATEQRGAERALALAKERLELAIEGGNIAEWDMDIDAGEIFLGHGWPEMLDCERSGELRNAARLLRQIVHRDDQEAIRRAYVRALKGAGPYEVEYRVYTRAGEWKWVRAVGRVTDRDAQGRAHRMSGTVADIDERRRAENALRYAEQRYRSLIELAPDGVVVSCGGVIEYANAAAARILGFASARQLVGRTVEEFVHPEQRERFRERRRYLEQGPGANAFEERRLVRGDGSEVVVESAGVSLLVDGRLVVQSVLRDVTEQRRAREALAERERRFRDVVEASGEYVWETDAGGRFIYLSERVEAVLGYAQRELLGKTPRDFLPLGEEPALEVWLGRGRPEGQAFRDLIHRAITKSGRVIWQSVSAVPVRDPAGQLRGYRGTAADVTARKQAEARIEYLATRDALTGLSNRALLTERANQALVAAARSRGRLALLVFGLDRFQLVNDSLGHQAGDALLRAVAERLSNTLRREDTLARLGGDTFVLLWEGLRTAQDAAVVAQRILGILARPFVVEGRPLSVSASIGVSVYPDDGHDFGELLKHADAAMHHAKEGGRGVFRFFSGELHSRAEERLRLENELRSALVRGELVLHYQPVVRGRRAAAQVVGAEALVRWQHPTRGLLMPDEFVPLAEHCGLIRAVGEWTMERMLARAGAWQRALPGAPWLALNVSAAELAQGEAYVARLGECLRANGVDGTRIELEVTERVLMSSLEENVATLRRIGELGVRFAIDDFGTGYSSLAYLRQLPIDKLKIDRAFLKELETHRADEAIVRTIAAMAKTLGLAVAAEGVESEAQLARLLALGCDEWQGHHFCPPLAAAEFERLIAPRAAAAS
jgi:diguanylate cyclase (GGDEF)-like protein/PAS domain S-box-containing protein